MANLREALDISDYETAEASSNGMTYTVKHDDNPAWSLSVADGAMPPHVARDYASLDALIEANPELGDMEWTAIGEDGEPIEK